MISFEHRVVSEYKIKISKVDTLAKSIMNHREPKSTEAKEASEFLDVLVNEIDGFYKEHSEILSKNGKDHMHALVYLKLNNGLITLKDFMN